jgi:hypothetical protein
MVDGTGTDKPGYKKISISAKQAMKDDLRFLWVDTCCIDKSSSAELSEAINSMFRWYQNATKCYVYLSDISIGSCVKNDSSFEQTWRTAFQYSRWFTRGWTLQELLAPKYIDFLSVEGERLGDKTSLVQELHDRTKIPIRALQGIALCQFSIKERMSWAEGRETGREEDAAYSLLGIFNVHMPLIYGEGRESAFNRLQKEVREKLGEELPQRSLSAALAAKLNLHPLHTNPDPLAASTIRATGGFGSGAVVAKGTADGGRATGARIKTGRFGRQTYVGGDGVGGSATGTWGRAGIAEGGETRNTRSHPSWCFCM